jgi:hypothetical protein
MLSAHAHYAADGYRSARHYPRAFLLLLMTGLMAACGSSGSTEWGAPTMAGGGIASLAWDPVAGTNLAGYRIYYGTAPGVYIQPLGQGLNVAGTSTTYTIAGLQAATRYYFAATAYDATNNETSFSNEVFKDIP